MSQRWSIILAGCLLITPSPATVAEVRDDAKELQGTWTILEIEVNGEKKPEDAKDAKVIIKDDEIWAVKPAGADPKLKFRLDPARDPRTIDLTVQEGDDRGKIVRGIYELKGGRLRLCINIFGDPSHRPTEFKTEDRDGAALAVLERAKGE